MEIIKNIENGRIVNDSATTVKLIDCDNCCQTVVNNCHLDYPPTWWRSTPSLIGNYVDERDGITYYRVAIVVYLGGGRYKVVTRF